MDDKHDYLVNVEVHWPPDGDPALRYELVTAEAKRAEELVAEGTLVRLWRVPGRWANWGIWRAGSPAELHAAIASLPFFPWLDVTVHPLAEHPSDPVGRS
ncbi:MAG: muconolactone Delta-isomerase family protein [Actinomycetota bacterium]